VAGKTQTLLDHVLFALKHEGVNMQVLAQALPKLGKAADFESMIFWRMVGRS
jgi:hypothetical protein